MIRPKRQGLTNDYVLRAQVHIIFGGNLESVQAFRYLIGEH